jgi:hypothetical protein
LLTATGKGGFRAGAATTAGLTKVRAHRPLQKGWSNGPGCS